MTDLFTCKFDDDPIKNEGAIMFTTFPPFKSMGAFVAVETRVFIQLLHMEVRLHVLLCAVKTVEGDFRFCWTITPNIGQTHKENPNLVRILYMVCTLNDIYKQYNKLHEH